MGLMQRFKNDPAAFRAGMALLGDPSMTRLRSALRADDDDEFSSSDSSSSSSSDEASSYADEDMDSRIVRNLGKKKKSWAKKAKAKKAKAKKAKAKKAKALSAPEHMAVARSLGRRVAKLESPKTKRLVAVKEREDELRRAKKAAKNRWLASGDPSLLAEMGERADLDLDAALSSERESRKAERFACRIAEAASVDDMKKQCKAARAAAERKFAA